MSSSASGTRRTASRSTSVASSPKRAAGADAVRRLRSLRERVARGETDAAWIRAQHASLKDFKRLMLAQSARFLEP